jgi:PAS domain S-box-containing protein
MALITIVAVMAPALANAQPRTVRVGVYENEPKIFTVKDGEARPSGIFPDLLQQIAEEEGWTIVWVPGTWDEGLSALENGQIDLMSDVGYSAKRDEVYDFHQIAVLNNWSCIYTTPEARIDEMAALDGKRVAVLAGSIQETIFSEMAEKSGYNIGLVPASSLKEVFELTANGKVDAGIANNLFGDYFRQEYGLTRTSIVFGSVPFYFATQEGQNSDLLEAIDAHLSTWIRDSDSVYYETLDRYLTSQPSTRLPSWAIWLVSVIGALLAISLGGVALLRWQVRVKTKHLAAANEATAQAEETLRLALEASHEGIFDWYPGTGEIIWSPRNYTMLGYEPDEFPMDIEKYTDLIHPDDREPIAEKLRQIAANGLPFSIEFRLRRKSGDWLWTNGRGMAVAADAHGEVQRVMGTNTDISERKKVEEELEEYKVSLEGLVEERTRELEESNAELVEANAAKSRFLTTMSHELRTPLNSIIGFSGLLTSGLVGELSEEQLFQIGMIQDSGKHLLELINDILDLSKVEAGAVVVHPSRVKPAEVISAVMESVRPLAAQKGLELRVEIPREQATIETDKDRLRQILLNIVGNAVKFSAQGEVCVHFECLCGTQVIFRVSDTGPGIPADEIAYVFDEFHQVEQKSGALPGGTGMGLAISQDLAHLLGGEITVTSTEGEGSVFTLVLPTACTPQE